MYNENDLVLHNKFTVTSADTDMFRRLKGSSLVNFLIQSAINSADKLGFGFVNLKTHKLFWVLSRFTLEVYKPLYWYDTAKVETWPKSVDGLLYIRDFIVYNTSNEIVAKATSGWLAIDIENKKPKLFNGIQAQMLVSLQKKYALDFVPHKLDGVESGEIFTTRATYSDIDLNGHVTTTRYLEWIMDTFEPQFHKEMYTTEISINFMKEIMTGDQIKIVRSTIDKDLYHFEGSIENRLKSSFRAQVSFKKL